MALLSPSRAQGKPVGSGRRAKDCIDFGGLLQKASHWKMLLVGDLFCYTLVILPGLI